MCGLPGSGKTTLAKRLESSLRAIRFSADEWMVALSLDIYDEEMRGKIEALQWRFARELLGLGLTVVIEWGTCGAGLSGTPCGLKLGCLALRWSSTISRLRWMFSSTGFNSGVWRTLR